MVSKYKLRKRVRKTYKKKIKKPVKRLYKLKQKLPEFPRKTGEDVIFKKIMESRKSPEYILESGEKKESVDQTAEEVKPEPVQEIEPVRIFNF